MRAGDGGEGAKHWPHILTEIKNRGGNDVQMQFCGRFKGLPEAVESVWPRTAVRTCVVHLMQNFSRHGARRDWDKIAKMLKPLCTAATEEAAPERFAEFADNWGEEVPGDRGCCREQWIPHAPVILHGQEVASSYGTTSSRSVLETTRNPMSSAFGLPALRRPLATRG
ncbi:transposase [Streptomyces atratus]